MIFESLLFREHLGALSGSGLAEAGISPLKINIQKGQDLIANTAHPVKTELHTNLAELDAKEIEYSKP